MPPSGHKTPWDFAALVARRIWTPEDKRRLVAEMGLPGANVSEISRRHGVANSLLYRWRQDAVAGKLPERDAPKSFLPVSITRDPLAHAPATGVAAAIARDPLAPVSVTTPIGSVAKPGGTLDIVLANGRRLWIAADIDVVALKRIVAALETMA